MKYAKEILLGWVEKIQEQGRGLTDWEQRFVESLAEQLNTRGILSERQEEILERVYSEKTP